ncbi:hypothetical protein ERO13_A11G316842v2 [Gossypium hirsutum]|uniref:Uncharacterized protein n=2 Tax=Gossypium TaxID=3633 RepID=A0A5J5S772_GOSBA|nr:hypothetical protein ES319_D02G007500v1 [Gossypium barbadense]KAG4177589.1 hypothetical protein ERO13_A11G316842v2 [Gossypium hirsutum]TYI03959.1 hypothetical protein ES332_A11G380100v1 [Gossypium tomentosum]
MKFLILPYYPFCLPAEEATNGSPNRRRDSGESPFVDVSTTWLRRCQTHGGEGHARGVVVVVRKVAHGWPSVRRLEAWGSKLGFAENGVNLGLGLCLFWV